MHCAFQDNENLYLCLDYLDGGDLRYQMSQNKQMFDENQISSALLIRVLRSLHHLSSRLHPLEEHHSPRRQARESGVR